MYNIHCILFECPSETTQSHPVDRVLWESRSALSTLPLESGQSVSFTASHSSFGRCLDTSFDLSSVSHHLANRYITSERRNERSLWGSLASKYIGRKFGRVKRATFLSFHPYHLFFPPPPPPRPSQPAFFSSSHPLIFRHPPPPRDL